VTPDQVVKQVGDAVHRFVHDWEESGAPREHVLLVLFNASIRLLLRGGLRPKDLKRMLNDSLCVIRRQG